VILAALGLVSGALSATWGTQAYTGAPYLQSIARVFALAPELVPIGAFFATAIAVGMWWFSGRLLAVPVVIVVTMYAWSAAIQVAIRTQRHADDDPHLLAASLGAGAVGAGITHLGCAIFASGLRRPASGAATVIVGALAGLFLYLTQRGHVGESWLYLVWQPAVAGVIGAGMSERPTNAAG
jgi:hypothetical protein